VSVPGGWRSVIVAAAVLACRSNGREAPPATGGTLKPLEARPLPVADRAPEIGTAHPVRLIASADSGRWVVACQARVDTDGKPGIRVTHGYHNFEGDAMTPYLFRGGGEGQALDAFLDSSRDGRWIAVLRGGQLVVIDDVQGTESVVSGADVRPDPAGFRHVAVFDAASERLVFFHRVGDARQVVVRDLVQQREREVAFQTTDEIAVVPEHQGTWATVRLKAEDADIPGMAVANDQGKQQTCGNTTSYRSFLEDGYDVREIWLKLDTGEVKDDRSVIAHVGDLEVVKSTDAAVRVGPAVIIPARCDAEVLAVFPRPLRIVARCSATTPDAPVELFGEGVRVVLGPSHWTRSAAESVRIADASFVCIEPARCFAVQDGRPIAIRGYAQDIRGYAVIKKAGTKILTKDRGAYFITDVVTGITQDLPGVVGLNGRARAGSIVVIGSTIVDVAAGRVLGKLARPPVAVDTRGRALLAGPDPVEDELPSGPLRWAATTCP
jgi:hypothetical protein